MCIAASSYFETGEEEGEPAIVIECLGDDAASTVDLVAWPVDRPRCPVGSGISCVISSGWRSAADGRPILQLVSAPINLAMTRSRSGLIVQSSIEAA